MSMTAQEPKLDTKTWLTIIGMLMMGVVAFYASRLAVANDLADIRIAATQASGKIENNAATISEMKESIRVLNAKVDILLIDNNHIPALVEKQVLSEKKP